VWNRSIKFEEPEPPNFDGEVRAEAAENLFKAGPKPLRRGRIRIHDTIVNNTRTGTKSLDHK